MPVGVRLAYGKYFCFIQRATLTRPIRTAASTSGLITAAKASPELIPNTDIATAIFSPGFVRGRVSGLKLLCSVPGRGLFTPVPVELSRSPTHPFQGNISRVFSIANSIAKISTAPSALDGNQSFQLWSDASRDERYCESRRAGPGWSRYRRRAALSTRTQMETFHGMQPARGYATAPEGHARPEAFPDRRFDWNLASSLQTPRTPSQFVAATALPPRLR